MKPVNWRQSTSEKADRRTVLFIEFFFVQFVIVLMRKEFFGEKESMGTKRRGTKYHR